MISSNWILTAAHCFLEQVNEQDIRIEIGRKDCLESDHEIRVTIEMIKPDKTIFMSNEWNDNWDGEYNGWINCLGTDFGLLTTDREEYDRAEERNKTANAHMPDELHRISNNQDKNTCMCNRVMTHEFENDYISPYFNLMTGNVNIALIETDTTIITKSICHLSSASVDTSLFKQHIYFSGYGYKGSETMEGFGNDYLTWISMFNIKEMETRYKNLTFDTVILGSEPDTIYYFFITIADFIYDNLITSAVRMGDSGGPVFVYATYEEKYMLFKLELYPEQKFE